MKGTSQQNSQKNVQWQSVGENLVRYNPSRKYYARIRVRGKLIVRSLKTKSLAVAKTRKADLEKAERTKAASQDAVVNGKMTFGDALATFRKRLDGDVSLKQRSKEYREERIAALTKSWPSLEATDVRAITKNGCLDWAADYCKNRSATNYNNTVGSLKLVLDIAVEAGAIYDNPARFIKRARVRVEEPVLPSEENFEKILTNIKHKCCADLVRFLAFGGFRLREASKVTWADVDLLKGEIVVRGDELTHTKNGEIRRVPLIPAMRELLERLQKDNPDRKPTDSVMTAKECQGSLDAACEEVGIPRITHHDLRHLFVTKCLECNVNPKVIAQWAGHKDGGVLILTRYGHVRPDHSAEMALQVKFSKSPAPEAKAA